MDLFAYWDNPDKTIIRVDCIDALGWLDLFAALEETNLLLDTIDHQAIVIIDASHAQNIVLNAMNTRPYELKNRLIHPHRYPNVIVVGGSISFQSLMALSDLLKESRGQFQLSFAASLEEAYDKANDALFAVSA